MTCFRTYRICVNHLSGLVVSAIVVILFLVAPFRAATRIYGSHLSAMPSCCISKIGMSNPVSDSHTLQDVWQCEDSLTLFTIVLFAGYRAAFPGRGANNTGGPLHRQHGRHLPHRHQIPPRETRPRSPRPGVMMLGWAECNELRAHPFFFFSLHQRPARLTTARAQRC